VAGSRSQTVNARSLVASPPRWRTLTRRRPGHQPPRRLGLGQSEGAFPSTTSVTSTRGTTPKDDVCRSPAMSVDTPWSETVNRPVDPSSTSAARPSATGSSAVTAAAPSRQARKPSQAATAATVSSTTRGPAALYCQYRSGGGTTVTDRLGPRRAKKP
jgi:hypothetical protein